MPPSLAGRMPASTTLCCVIAVLINAAFLNAQEAFPGTALLSPVSTNIVQIQLAQVTNYFQRQIDLAEAKRTELWQPKFSSRRAYERSIAPHRDHFRQMLGLVEPNRTAGKPQTDGASDLPGCRVERVTIPIVDGWLARGLLFVPQSTSKKPVVVVCPDADTWPEQSTGLDVGKPVAWLTSLLRRGVMVYVPQSIERLQDHPYCQQTRGKDRRWILHRLGYVVGRSMPGLDVQEVLAAIDYLAQRKDVDAQRIGLAGAGQGGMTAFFAAALDQRVTAVAVADYFQNRNHCWAEPVDRRLRGELLEFGDAEVAAMIAPRKLFILSIASSPMPPASVSRELLRAIRFYTGLAPKLLPFNVLTEPEPTTRFYMGSIAPSNLSLIVAVPPAALLARATAFVAEALAPSGQLPSKVELSLSVPADQARGIRDQHFTERLAYLRRLIDASEAARYRHWGITNQPAAKFPQVKAAMLEEYRRFIGQIPLDGTTLNPRTRLVLKTDKYAAYQVLLGVVEGVEVYGNLLVPAQHQGRLAAVICQHGLTGTPEMITGIGQTKDTPYHEFGRKLAERGYVVFAPLLVHHDPPHQINNQMRQADALGMARVAMPVAKTERVIDFLAALPFVDPQRIGYYGLSYGGYSALWIAPLAERLAVVVPSGHFNDWRTKITSDKLATSFLLHPNEDMYNWNVLHRFTHPELIVMMTPRPVCIEFGLRDGITTPEWTAYAWKQVEQFRDHLGLGDRVQLATFDGVHEVKGEQSFEFLDRFLRDRPVGKQ